MRRIQGLNVTPGDLFKSRDTVLNEPGTIVKRQFMNDIQESISQFIESTGATVDLTAYAAQEVGDPLQEAAAVALYSATAGQTSDSGLVNAYILSTILDIAPIRTLHDGLRLIFKPLINNTGNSTVNYNDLGVKQIRNVDGTQLLAGQLLSSNFFTIQFVASSNCFVLINEVQKNKLNDFFRVQFVDYQSMIDNVENSINFTGQKITTGSSVWKTTTTVTLSEIDNTSPQLYAIPLNGLWIEDFGVVENTDFSTEFRLAITLGTVRLPSKRYIYDGVVITTAVVKVRGDKAPTVNAGFTSLENGSIIEGTFSTTAKTVDIRDWWCDLGTDTDAPDGDGIKCTTALNAGTHCHAQNVGALLKNKTSPFHATLFESYLKLTGGNISGNHGFFGCVIKCQNVVLRGIYTKNNDKDGLFLKSDNNFGICKKVNITGVVVIGDGSQDFGIRVQADTAILERVKIRGVHIEGCNTGIIGQTLTTFALADVTITDIFVSNPALRVVYAQVAATGIIINFHINQISATGVLDTGIEFSGDCRQIGANGVDIAYHESTTQAEWDKGIVIGSAVGVTTLDNISISQSFVPSTVGAIKYNNSPEKNTIGQYTCNLLGTGKPLMGRSDPSSSGASVTMSPTYNRREKSSLTKSKHTSNSTVTAFDILYDGINEYDEGYVHTIICDSSFTLTINNTFGGKIQNRAGANITLLTQETASWVFGGSVWHQTN